MIETVEDLLCFEEGYRADPYYCSEGYPTIGIGTRIGPKGAALVNYQMHWSRDVAYAHLREEVKAIEDKIGGYPWFQRCNGPRRAVLVSMAYQMGVSGLLGFRNTLQLIGAGDYVAAGGGMRQSRWYKQTPARAERHARVMESGTFDAYNAGGRQ